MLSSPIDEIKSRLDIVEVIQSYIKVEKAGANYRAVCPFHSEKKPSFFISPARQIWHCFGCGKGGDIFGFVKEINGVEFGDALRILAQKAGVELVKEDPKVKTERQRLYEICELSNKFFEHQLENSAGGKEAKKYLLDRGVKEETIKNWRIGYSPDVWQGLSNFLVSRGYKREEMEKAGLALKSYKTGNYFDRFRGRIMFPILDLSSHIVGFGGRIFKQKTRPDNLEEAKYVNTPATVLYDKSKVLYGLNKAGVEIRRKNQCVMVEGYMDAIMAHQAGTENVVATSGTALTEFQLKILKRYSDNLLTSFDMDIAGDSATKRGIGLAQALGFNIKIVVMPEGLDPGDVAKDPENWQNLINNPKSIHDFYIETTLSRFDKNTLEGKKEISKVLLPVIKKIPNKIEETYWVQSLAGVLNVKEEDIREELKKIKPEGIGEYEEVLEAAPAVSAKPRKEILEEHLISLAIKYPKNIGLVEEEDFSFFLPQTGKIINYLKEKETNKNAELAEEYKGLLDILFLKAEAIFEDEKIGKTDEEINNIIESDFKCCLKSIKMLSIKNRLDEICSEIRKAEQEKDSDKVKKLVDEFNSCSKSRCEMESA